MAALQALELPDFFRPADAPLLPLLTERLRILECQAFALKLRQWLVQRPDWRAHLLITIDRSSVDNLPIKFEIHGLGQQERADIKQLTQDLRPLLTFANDPFASSVASWLRNASSLGTKLTGGRALEIVESCLDYHTNGAGKECFRIAAQIDAGVPPPALLSNYLSPVLDAGGEAAVESMCRRVEMLLVQQLSVGVLEWKRQVAPHADAMIWLKSVYDDFDPCLMTLGGQSAQAGDDVPFQPLLALLTAHSRQKHRVFKEFGDEVLRQFNKEGWNPANPEECVARAWEVRNLGDFAEYSLALRASVHRDALDQKIIGAPGARPRL